MGWEDAAWGKTIPELIELMKSPQPGSTNFEYYARILQYNYLKKLNKIPKRLMWATWALVVATGLSVLAAFIK